MIEKATNKTVPIITFAAGEGPGNSVISSFDVKTRSDYIYDPGAGPTTVEIDSCVVLSVLAIGSTYVTFLVIFGREGVDNAVLCSRSLLF